MQTMDGVILIIILVAVILVVEVYKVYIIRKALQNRSKRDEVIDTLIKGTTPRQHVLKQNHAIKAKPIIDSDPKERRRDG